MEKIKFLVLVGIFVASKAFALQVKTFEEGTALDFDISANELSHIVVEDDRITGIKNALDNLAIEQDEERGHLFVRPLGKPELVQVFLITEQGKTLSLRLTPQDIPAESIRIKSDSILEGEGSVSKTLEEDVIELISALYQQTELEGYQISSAPQSAIDVRGLSLKKTVHYRGSHLMGIAYSVENTHSKPLHLLESDFFEPGVRAISIPQKTVAPKAQTKIYLVKELH